MGEENAAKVREILQNVAALMMGLSNPNLHLVSHVWPLQVGEIESLSKNEKVHKSKHWNLLTSLKYPKSYSDRAIQLIRGASLALPATRVIERRYLLETRLYVGLGATAWELGLAYLNPYGIPWIPGSSLKGAMRASLIYRLLEGGVSLDEVEAIRRGELGVAPAEVASKFADRGEEITNAVKILVDLFGTAKYRGRLVAFGGFVTSWRGCSPIRPEVMTPHYRRYYSDETGRTYPSEMESPNPIHFPVIGEGTTFTFILAVPEESFEEVVFLLDETLTKRGMGAKKSSGFGIFRRVG